MTSFSVTGALDATPTLPAPNSPTDVGSSTNASNDGLFASALTQATAQFVPPSASPGGLFVGYEGPTASLGTGLGAPSEPSVSTWLTLAAASPVGSPALTTGSTPGVSALVSSPLSSPTAPSTTLAPTSTTTAPVVATAEQYVGTPYLWGGTTPSGFDCSGFVQYVFARCGVNLPRTSEEQATVGQPVASLAAARPGDLLFFAGSDGTASAPGHVAIYVGGDQMIDAPYTGTTVRVETIPAGSIVAIRRVAGA